MKNLLLSHPWRFSTLKDPYQISRFVHRLNERNTRTVGYTKALIVFAEVYRIVKRAWGVITLSFSPSCCWQCNHRAVGRRRRVVFNLVSGAVDIALAERAQSRKRTCPIPSERIPFNTRCDVQMSFNRRTRLKYSNQGVIFSRGLSIIQEDKSGGKRVNVCILTFL